MSSAKVESCLEREMLEKRNLLFPVRLDSTIMDATEAWAASIRRQRHIGDFTKWKNDDAYWKGFERLLRDLRRGRGTSALCSNKYLTLLAGAIDNALLVFAPARDLRREPSIPDELPE